MRKIIGRRNFIFICLVINSLLMSTLILGSEEAEKKDIHYFIEKGWQYHSSIKQARFDIKKYKNMELEAISVYTPKIDGMTWIAPMYTINKTNDPWETQLDYDNWGPYCHLDLLFQQPIFAFTRVLSGIRAAREGQNVARADVEITKWNVAKEIRLYYYGIVFGKTMLRTIDMAEDVLSGAIEKAEESLEKGEMDITEVDVSKLKYFYSQIPINKSFAEKSIKQAQMALFLSTGETLLDEDLPVKLEMESFEEKSLSEYLMVMLEKRPLLKKLTSGINATRHLMNLEYKAMIPVLFAGGFIKYNFAPTVDFHSNKFLLNNYNTFGEEGRNIDFGIAFGFIWDFDPLKFIAKGLQKKAELDKLLELYNYAMQGFPVQLEKVLLDMNDFKVKIEVLKEAIKNAQTWMFFAANAYAIGGGEARDIMEGLAAYVKAKTDYYQTVYDYNKLIGELSEIIGERL